MAYTPPTSRETTLAFICAVLLFVESMMIVLRANDVPTVPQDPTAAVTNTWRSN